MLDVSTSRARLNVDGHAAAVDRRAVLTAFAGALLAVAIATALTGLMWPWSGLAPFALFYIAVLLVALYGNLMAGALAGVLSILAVDFFFFAPQWRFTLDVASLLASALFATGVGLVTVLARRLQSDARLRQRHEAEIERLNRLYAALIHINQAIAASPTREVLFPIVCETLVRHGGFRMAWIGWPDPLTQGITPVAQCGDDTGYLRDVRAFADERPGGHGPSGRALRQRSPYICNDILDEPSMASRLDAAGAQGLRALAAFPVLLHGRVRALLNVYAGEPGFFQAKEIGLLTEAAKDISLAIDKYEREAEAERMKEVARVEQAFSATMIESMPGIVYFYSEAGGFIRWNSDFERVSGYTGAEIATMHPLDFFAGDDQSVVADKIAEVFESGASSVEALFKSNDGTLTPYLATGRRIRFNAEECLLGVGVDITVRKRAEDKLRSSEANLNNAQRIGKMGSWVLDMATQHLEWSAQIYEMFAVAPTDGAPLYPLFLERIHPRDRERFQREEQEAQAGRARLDIEHAIVLPDGTEKMVHEAGELVCDAHGRPLRMVGTVVDITERHRTEMALRDLNESLERKVGERTSELQAALVRAESADRIKTAFLAAMSHELRTPLNSILGFTGILLQGLAGALNAEQSRQLGMVRTSARHLLELINDVLDISKIEAGQLEVRLQPFRIDASIQRVVASVQPMADAKGLALDIQLSDGLDLLCTDQRRFEQIALNLVNNAIKFTERGTVTISVQIMKDTPSTPMRPGQEEICVRVSDTGIGIHKADLATLFQPFRQVDTGLARQYEGTGLGLAICARLAALLGGRIEARSVWGQGSTFALTLPLARRG